MRGSFQVLIWSFEHNGWWAPRESGYVENVADAGLYWLDHARFGKCGVLLCIPERSHCSLRKAEYRSPAAVDEVLFRQKIKCAGRIELLIGVRGAVSRNFARSETIDGQCNVPPEET